MSYFLDYIVQEAKSLGIKTLDDIEFENMMKDYGIEQEWFYGWNRKNQSISQ